MNALSVTTSCTLALAWSAAVPGGGSGNIPVSPPAVANGVVYFGSGGGNTVYAINAQSGVRLWSSTLGAAVYAAPVIDKHLFVGSWDHKLYAFGV